MYIAKIDSYLPELFDLKYGIKLNNKILFYRFEICTNFHYTFKLCLLVAYSEQIFQ